MFRIIQAWHDRSCLLSDSNLNQVFLFWRYLINKVIQILLSLRVILIIRAKCSYLSFSRGPSFFVILRSLDCMFRIIQAWHDRVCSWSDSNLKQVLLIEIFDQQGNPNLTSLVVIPYQVLLWESSYEASFGWILLTLVKWCNKWFSVAISFSLGCFSLLLLTLQ